MFAKDWKQYLFILFITLLFSYIIGITILSVINQRLTDISINVPTPQVNFTYPSKIPDDELPKKEVESFTMNPSTNLNYHNDDLRGFVNQKEYHDCTEATSQIEEEKIQQMNNVCLFRHDHNKYLCSYGKTNYINPFELDPMNRRIYKYNYMPNMTLQDYINWLWLYDNENNDSDKLCYEHYKNLKKIKNNKALVYQKGICPPNLKTCSTESGLPLDLGEYHRDMIQKLNY